MIQTETQTDRKTQAETVSETDKERQRDRQRQRERERHNIKNLPGYGHLSRYDPRCPASTFPASSSSSTSYITGGISQPLG